MKIIRSIPALQKWTAKNRVPVVFVPTMGALHEGHMDLVRRARREAGRRGSVVVSIFVNPSQFNQKSDLAKYPRQLRRDAALCKKAGVDLIFAPSTREIYPPDFSTWVEETRLSLPLCGASRPGHFRGVCTVVLKLFNLVQPDVAIFGQKDAQQALVVRRMVRDLNVPVRLKIATTVREANGLAMSSRNERLASAERERAAGIFAALGEARRQFRSGERKAGKLKSLVRGRLKKISGVKIDYVELVNSETLGRARRAKGGDLLAVAVFLGRVRLIDNVFL